MAFKVIVKDCKEFFVRDSFRMCARIFFPKINQKAYPHMELFLSNLKAKVRCCEKSKENSPESLNFLIDSFLFKILEACYSFLFTVIVPF
ncbi:MAG: hypothetical protein D4S01_11240 [Dehalococcoidia bacterium]|nr:MAG: hypothetical protein D4S01_11240 [Dehalococcoidia bacterium]